MRALEAMDEPQYSPSGAPEEPVRAATSDDLDDITRLYVELRDHHRPLQPHNPRYHVADEGWARTARRALDDPRSVVLVAEEDGVVVGFVALTFVDKPWGLSCEVGTLVVERARRGRGHGAALMAAAEARARSEGAKGMRVEVLEGNQQARAFYHRLGYGVLAQRMGKPVR
jgi:ribosomal protein S18 acetylase RimI-like enzyme